LLWYAFARAEAVPGAVDDHGNGRGAS
jgi:hypothetical protein